MPQFRFTIEENGRPRDSATAEVSSVHDAQCMAVRLVSEVLQSDQTCLDAGSIDVRVTDTFGSDMFMISVDMWKSAGAKGMFPSRTPVTKQVAV